MEVGCLERKKKRDEMKKGEILTTIKNENKNSFLKTSEI